MINIKYTNSNGIEVNLLDADIRLTEGGFHSRKWNITSTKRTYGERIKSFKKDSISYKVTATIRGTLEDRYQLLDYLTDTFEADIINQTSGRLTFGDYYIDGYVVESETKPNGTFSYWTDIEITFLCPHPFWIREQYHSFVGHTSEAESGLDYSYDYNYDYAESTTGFARWDTEHYAESDFRLTFYGQCSNPKVNIAGHPYGVDMVLAEDESCVIDSRINTVTFIDAYGNETSAFNSRSKEASVFERIPGGEIPISWSGAFGFDIVLYQERSEPRWS